MTQTRRHALKDKSGKYRPSSKSPAIRWTKPGSEGFWNLVSDVEPRILMSTGTYEKWIPADFQREALNEILSDDAAGRRRYLLAMLCWGRRTGKSYLICLLEAHRLVTVPNFYGLILSTKREQAVDVSFRLLKNTIIHTPKLLRLIKSENIYADHIDNPKLGGTIQAISNSMAGAFGRTCNLLHASEIHISPNLEPFRAAISSLTSSKNSMTLIDTNTDQPGGPVHEIEMQAKTDRTVYVNRIEHENFEAFKKNCPPWLNVRQIEQLKALQLPAEFARDFLNLRTSAANALFTKETIAICKTKYSIPVGNVNELLQGRSYAVGAGLDRAKSLIQSRHSDATVWTVTAKTTAADGQPEYWILSQKTFRINTSKAIKAQITKDHERYNIDSCIMEHYETGDLVPHVADLGIKNFELLAATPTLQNSIFPELFRVSSSGNLHFSTDLKTLASEMGTFIYEQNKNGLYKFSHSSQRYHDDTVFSLAYSIHATRANLVRLYELGNIVCKNKSVHRSHCFLMSDSGHLTLLCAPSCDAYQQVKLLYAQYKKFQIDSELSVEEFHKNHVRHVGSRIQQAA